MPPSDAQLAALSLVAFDVDGVFTDGRFYLSDAGTESKAFHTQDGYGVRQLIAAGVEIAVISGRASAAVELRMRELGVRHVHLAAGDKVAVLTALLSELELPASRCAFVGDDVPDLAVMRQVGLGIAVANAHGDVQAFCEWTTARDGGHGAVREICDAILEARRGQATA